jgi:DsbC/DsbD-like thiol-disulfide interchange protein
MIEIQPHLRKVRAISAFGALFLSAAATAAPAETAWMPGALSKARLVAAGGLDRQAALPVHRLAIEIALTGDAHTYWRMPGDAGVPPTINFEGSQNLKSAELAFPVPQRIDEAGLQIFGYKGSVLLPLSATPADPSKPVRLVFTFTYAACEKICIPADARATLELDPRAKPSAHAPRIAAATAAVPQRSRNGEAATLDLSKAESGKSAGEKPAWAVKVAAPAGAWTDLFAEAPDGWYFETSKTPEGFRLVAADKPKDATYPVPVRLTLAGERASFDIDVEVPSP